MSDFLVLLIKKSVSKDGIAALVRILLTLIAGSGAFHAFWTWISAHGMLAWLFTHQLIPSDNLEALLLSAAAGIAAYLWSLWQKVGTDQALTIAYALPPQTATLPEIKQTIADVQALTAQAKKSGGDR